MACSASVDQCDGAIACDACERVSGAESVERRCSHGVQLRVDVLAAAEHAAEAWEAAASACCEPAAAVALGAYGCHQLVIESSHATACERLSEAVSVERRCSRAVQLRIHVLTAAEHAVQAQRATQR